MKFIDLFAGLGGFHVALSRLGHECVFASEKKDALAKLYEQNFNIKVNRDITKIPVSEIPQFDILCAGFPCQPFSKAGSQKGLEDERNGTLFDTIVDILEHHRPRYFILENVRNLESHDNQNTWNYIKKSLVEKLGYSISKQILSPHEFGIPQHRERLFIVGSNVGLEGFKWPSPDTKLEPLTSYLLTSPTNCIPLEAPKIEVLDIWQEFIDRIPKKDPLPGFPIWAMEYDATYPFEEVTPFYASNKKLSLATGAFGIPLKGMSKFQKLENIPNYAKRDEESFPIWKKNYIRNNRMFFQKHKKRLAPIMTRIQELGVSSWQKFEWNVKGGERDLSKYIIQFRGSGVRIKKPDFFPSLVTVSTQIPILGWENRYITPEEGAMIQSLEGITLPSTVASSFSALGNAVNSYLVELIASNLIFNQDTENLVPNFKLLNTRLMEFKTNINLLAK